jgi:hypothetical protein
MDFKAIMKNLTRILTITLLTLTAFGQGSVQLNNRIAGVVDARITHADGSGLFGSAYTAELALVVGGATIPLVPSTVFRSTSAAAAGYVVPVDIQVPGIQAGEHATLILRAYETIAGSYENAVAIGAVHGQSNPVIIELGGTPPGGLPMPPNPLVGLGLAPAGSEPVNWLTSENRPPAGTVSAIQVVPEPSMFAVAIVGLGAVFLSRRRTARHTLGSSSSR